MLRALSLLAGDEAEQPVPEPVVVNLQMGGNVGVVKLAPSTPLASINGLCDALIAGGEFPEEDFCFLLTLHESGAPCPFVSRQ